MSPFSNVHVKFDFAVLQYAFYCYYVIFLSLQSLEVLSMVQDPTFLTKSSYKQKILIKILTNYKVIPESSCFYFQPLKAKAQMPPGISPRCMTAVAPPRKPLGMKKFFARCPPWQMSSIIPLPFPPGWVRCGQLTPEIPGWHGRRHGWFDLCNQSPSHTSPRPQQKRQTARRTILWAGSTSH